MNEGFGGKRVTNNLYNNKVRKSQEDLTTAAQNRGSIGSDRGG
jgi:hypothetical protein